MAKNDDYQKKREAVERGWAEAAAAKRREREERRAANRAAHAARNDEWQRRREEERERKQDPLNDPFTIQMAAKLGITPQAFLDLQAERRGEVERVRSSGSVGAQLAKLTPIDEQVH